MNLQVIQNKIYEIRGQKIMLDFDLAELYSIETKVLKQAVKRTFKITNCDLEQRKRKKLQIHAFRFHRIRCSHVIFSIK